MAGSLDVRWIHGSASCRANTDPPIQVHQFDEHTFILRQNKCLNFEGPFSFLLFGEGRAFLLDTGAEPRPPHRLPVRDIVRGIIARWLTDHQKDSIELVIAHSHGHTDHAFGDDQFAGDPDTVVVEHNLRRIQSFFGLADWPNRTGTLDLGGRVLTLIPIPGHEETHIAVYDDGAELLLTGDTLYPGLLVIRDWPAYRKSIRRMVDFAETHNVSHILGCHIEMKNTPGELYEIGTTFQPDEHVLQLELAHLMELNAACEAMGDAPRDEIHDDFIIHPI